ncbi:velvet factor [Chlamydoabsidia padenii]|nr:velvet factor [Chlamydoabsidia padenii]
MLCYDYRDFLQNPYLFICVNLASATTKKEINRPDNRVLSGQTISSMYKLKDITDKDGGFFCFGDLSSRIEGEYRLKFSLFEIVTDGAVNLMHTFSNVFKVYNSKSMPRSLDATFLSRSFSDQGVRIRIRKEHRVQV